MKRSILAIVAGLTVGSAVFASAAYLGVSSDNLGAGDDSVTSCVSQVDTALDSAWDDGAGAFTVSAVDVSGIDAVHCAGQTVTVVLVDGDGTEVGSGSKTVSAATESVAIAASPSVADVEAIHVQIAG